MQKHFNLQNSSRMFFCAPTKNRTITASFSYLQRIGKGATTNIWLPKKSNHFLAEDACWAAIRHFDLLKEGDNLVIDELDIMDMKKSHEVLMSMRAGGYRITIITLGKYDDYIKEDQLAILDQKIRAEIANLINFLYLDELSKKETMMIEKSLQKQTWKYSDSLPHIARAISEKHIFKPEKENIKEKIFFEILESLSKKHIIHETAVGLVLPDATKEKNWIYIADEENRFSCFHNTINTVLRNVSEDMPVMKHMRSYGDHMKSSYNNFNKQSLQIL